MLVARGASVPRAKSNNVLVTKQTLFDMEMLAKSGESSLNNVCHDGNVTLDESDSDRARDDM